MSGSQEPEPIAAPNETRRSVEGLVARYRRNADQYASDSYKEAQLRQEFIDPLFEALGWDMANRQGYAEQYKEVVHEASIKISGETKAPDYSFRIGGQRKFFLEAKKPSVHVKDDPAPAYQLRRYAWSAKLPLSILTDFEEFAVYDCRKRPKQDDDASVARVDFITYDEYLARLDDIYTIFARESILKGSFDRYVQDTRGKRGTTEVDAEFLKEIEAWREMLAKDIAKNNHALSVQDLNFAVQATIDRILFFRIAEGRGVEEYGRLRGLVNGSKLYASLCDLYHEADEKYNAGLFDFSNTGDTLCPQLTISDQALKPILSKLYYPECPYEFSVIGADILGAVYEQFLGKVIRLTPTGMVKVEEKPEVKKAGGVYYTPTYIVDYIVQHTVGEALEEAATPNKASKLRILDPACGSGSFLLGAYQCLLNWHLDYYTSDEPEKHARGREPAIIQIGEKDWRLSTCERKRILLNNIYGVDIDPQAVEVTKFSLLLKCMEGETSETVDRQLRLTHERVLPNIDDNIKCGNSLIGPDYYEGRQQRMFDEDEMRRVNAFDWEAEFEEIMAAGGFDCVIGNPPYGRVQVLQQHHPEQLSYMRSHYRSTTGSFDIYGVFIEKGYGLLNARGRFGYIVPHKFFPAQFAEPLRELISTEAAISEIVHFGYNRVFAGADTYTCLLLLTSQPNARFRMVEMLDVDNIEAKLNETAGLSKREDSALRVGLLPAPPAGPAKWSFKIGITGALIEKLKALETTVADVTEKVFVGLQTSGDAMYILTVAEAEYPWGAEELRVYSQSLGKEVVIERGLVKPFLLGRDLHRYREPELRRCVIFPYEIEGGTVRLYREKELSELFPRGYEYLLANRDALRDREGGKMRHDGWYGYIYPKNLARFEQTKILMRELGDGPNLFPDYDGIYYHKTKIYSILPKAETLSLEILLAVLNSKLASFFVGNTSEIWGKSFKFKKHFVEALGIPAEAVDVERHDKMVGLVERMLELHKRLAEAKTQRDRELLQRQIDATDQEIDKLVYELYGLTEEEIGVVEGAAGGD